LYSVELIDYATPSFYSGTKTYYGDKESILRVLNHPEMNRPDMVEASKAFFEGRGDGIVRVFFGAPEPFIKPIKIIAEVEKEIDNFHFDHLNVWDCTYRMLADHVSFTCVYLEDSNGSLRRCIRADFTNLSLDDNKTRYLVREGKNWGHPGLGIIAEKQPVSKGIMRYSDLAKGEQLVTTTTLLTADRIFENMDQLMQDTKNPQNLDFSPIFDDVFGDG